MKKTSLIIFLAFVFALSSCGVASIGNSSSMAGSSLGDSLPASDSVSSLQTASESASGTLSEPTVTSIAPSSQISAVSTPASAISAVTSSEAGSSASSSSSSSSSAPVEKAIQFNDPLLEKLLRDCIKKPSGTCYPSDFRLLSRIQDNIYIQYSSFNNNVSLVNINENDVLSSASGWPANFEVLSQIPIRNLNLFYLTPRDSSITVNFDMSWAASSNELINFVYKDMEQLENKDHPRRMTFTNFDSLSGCTNLVVLLLWNCYGVELDTILNLRKIEVLSLKNCGITNIDGISNFNKLWKLELDYNTISDITPLANHPALKELYFAGMPGPIDVDTLLTIPQLDLLYLGNCIPLTTDERSQLEHNGVKVREYGAP